MGLCKWNEKRKKRIQRKKEQKKIDTTNKPIFEQLKFVFDLIKLYEIMPQTDPIYKDLHDAHFAIFISLYQNVLSGGKQNYKDMSNGLYLKLKTSSEHPLNTSSEHSLN